jgi:hypothetical protein
MRRITFAVAMLGALCASPARADTLTLPMFDAASVPDSYTPGVPFSFNLTLPALTNFTSYTMELVFTTELKNPNLNFTVDRGANYPFPPPPVPIPLLAVGAFDPNEPNVVHMFFSDTNTGTPAVTSDGDQFVTINVTAGAVGEIDVEVGPNTSFTHGMEDPNYRAPTDALVIAQGPPLSSVPAPGGAVLLGIGGLILAARRVRRAA